MRSRWFSPKYNRVNRSRPIREEVEVRSKVTYEGQLPMSPSVMVFEVSRMTRLPDRDKVEKIRFTISDTELLAYKEGPTAFIEMRIAQAEKELDNG